MIELPALRADGVLGFLAAVGVLRLVVDELDSPGSTLCWPNGAENSAAIDTGVASDIDSLAQGLFTIVDRCRDAGHLIPGRREIPLRATGGDAMNGLSFPEGRGLAMSLADDSVGQRWLMSMVSASGPDENEHLARSRWWAVGPGPVTIAGTLEKALEPIESADDLVGALRSWRRHDWVGGYLDHAADVGKERIPGTRRADESKAGVVGATWLALMSTVLFPIRSPEATRHETVGWSVIERRPTFGYPVWATPLDRSSIESLLDHPALIRTHSRGSTELAVLGVSSVWHSRRMRSGNNNTAMTPAFKVWPIADDDGG